MDQPNTAAEIRARLARLEPESARLWGRMTAHEAVCHMSDSFELAMGQRTNPRIRLPLPPTVIKVLALRAPLRWSRNFPTAPAVQQGIGGTPPSTWSEDILRLAAKLDAFSQKRADWPEHPFFRTMSTWDWMRWGYLHTDHHLRQFGC